MHIRGQNVTRFYYRYFRLGGLSSVQTWNGPGWSDRVRLVVTGSVNGNRDELIDTNRQGPPSIALMGRYNAGVFNDDAT